MNSENVTSGASGSFLADLSGPRLALLGSLLAFVIFVHYASDVLPLVHYASVVPAVALILFIGSRVGFWQSYAVAGAMAALMLSDAIWLGSFRYEVRAEIALVLGLPSALRAIGIRAEPARIRRAGGAAEGYWDSVARTPMGRYITEVETAFIHASLSRLAERPRLVIDAGAGTGRLTRTLAAMADIVVATEVHRDLADALSGVASNVVPLLVSPASRRLPVADGAADCVVCVEVPDLSHQPWFLAECHRVLKQGGMLIVTAQNALSWKGLLASVLRGRYRTKSGGRYYAHSWRAMARRLRRAGFEVERASGFNWMPLLRAADNPMVTVLAKVEWSLRLRRMVPFSPWVIASLRARRDGPSA